MPIDPRMVKWDEAPKTAPTIDPRMVKWEDVPQDKPRGFLASVGDVAAGALRGAGSIGATLLAPIDIASDALAGKGLTLESNRQRRAAMDAALGNMGADTDSWMYQGGKIGGEILGTAGAGGVLGNVAARLGASAPLVQALTSSGFSAGGRTGLAGMATRAAGGALTGGVTAAAVNPEDAATGAALGAALPIALQGAGKAAGALGRGVHNMRAPADAKAAARIADFAGMRPADLADALVQPGPSLIPGYRPTVPQIMQNDNISQLQRTLKTAGTNAIGEAERAQRAQLRAALERVAPIDLSVQDAAQRAGGAIESYAKPAYTQASKEVTQLFDAIPSNEAVMHLPLKEMESARAKFLGPGTFGKGGSAVDTAIDEATAIGTRPAPKPILDYSSSDLARKAAGGHSHGAAGETVSKAVPFDQLQKLRSSIGEAIHQADKNGQKQAKAALTAMKNAIDNKVAEVASGNKMADEVFTPDAIDKWGQALNAHGAKKAQFETGPQIGMFRQGGDGQTAMQGAEIPGKFFSGKRSQVEDVQAFKRLIGNRDDLAQELKRFATTEAASTGNVQGDLTSKYLKWLQSRSGAIKELFTAQELATLKEIGKAVEKGIGAENLGRVSGSDTAQKLAALNNMGLLDNKAVSLLANRVPIVGQFTGPMLSGLRETAIQSQNKQLAGLLADPEALAAALRKNTPGDAGLLRLLRPAGRGLLGAAPVISAQ